MDNYDQETGSIAKNVWSFFVGLLLGGVTGAVVMLLLAPQSGKQTRGQIRQQGIELRDQTVKSMEGAMTQARGKARQITDDVREQAGELQQRGQAMLDARRGHLSEALKDAGEAVEA